MLRIQHLCEYDLVNAFHCNQLHTLIFHFHHKRTNDTFVEQPAPSSKTPKKIPGRGQPTRGGRGVPQVGRSRGSGIARGRGAGTGSRHGTK